MRLKTTAVAVLAALLAVAALSSCGGDEESGTDPTTPTEAAPQRQPEPNATTRPQTETAPRPAVETIAIRDGMPVGGVAELEFSAGEQVRFRVRSDVADEVHVHGYDVTAEVGGGRPVAISFAADIEGIYEVELEERGVQIAELQVNP